MNRTITAFAAVLALVLCAPTGAEVYKWVDENGMTHYGQTPPVGTPSQPVSTPSAPASSGASSAPAQAAPAQQAPQGEDGAPAAEARGESDQPTETLPPEKVAETCAKVAQTLDTLRNRNRVLVKEGDGYAVMPPEQRKQKIQELEQWAAENC